MQLINLLKNLTAVKAYIRRITLSKLVEVISCSPLYTLGTTTSYVLNSYTALIFEVDPAPSAKFHTLFENTERNNF